MPGTRTEGPAARGQSAPPAILVQRCATCGTETFPPTGVCPRCGSRVTEAVTAGGRGRVVSATVNHQRWFPELEVPVVVVLVDLLDHPGVRLVGELHGPEPEAVPIGAEVALANVEWSPDGLPLPLFLLAPSDRTETG